MRLLVLEDDRRLNEAFVRRLRADGYAVDPATSLSEARRLFDETEYDGAVLDRMLPDGDALDLVISLRHGHQDLAILLVSGHADSDARLAGLLAGADGYIAKPLVLAELSLQVGVLLARAANRESAAEGPDVVLVGGLCVDRARRDVLADGEPVALSALQYRLLEVLASNAHRKVGREELRAAGWDRNAVLRRDPLPSQISRLRRRLEGTVVIASVGRYGYQLLPPEEPP